MIPERLNCQGRIMKLAGLTHSKKHLQRMRKLLPPNHSNNRRRLADRKLHEEVRQTMPFLLQVPQLADPAQHRTMQSNRRLTNDKALLHHHRLLRMIPPLTTNSTNLRLKLHDNNRFHNNTLLALSRLACNHHSKRNNKRRLSK